MAVQAQFPSNARFSPDFRSSNGQEIGHLLHSLWRPAAVAGDAMQRHKGLPNANDLSDNPPSSRKRIRTDDPISSHIAPPPGFPQQPGPNPSSGQPAGISPEVLVPFYQQNHEINALFSIQNERLRLAMLEVHKRCCNGLLHAHGQHMAKRLSEKEAELQNANRRNAELEKRLSQISAENLILFNLAKNKEAIVASLRTSLQQLKAQNTAAAAASAMAMEGYGDNEGTPLPATEAPRSAIECKACGDKEACVLVLPCRHLCLCMACETATGSCPICFKTKDESLHVFLS